MVPRSGVSTISPNHEVETDFDFFHTAVRLRPSILGLEPCLALAKIGTCELMVEEDLDVRHRVQGIENVRVEACPINGKDGL